MTDLFIGFCLGGGFAAIVHYCNVVLMAHKILRAKRDVEIMLADHFIKQRKHDV